MYVVFVLPAPLVFFITRWQVPFQRPVYRHLAEQKWRMDGTLDLLVRVLFGLFSEFINAFPDGATISNEYCPRPAARSAPDSRSPRPISISGSPHGTPACTGKRRLFNHRTGVVFNSGTGTCFNSIYALLLTWLQTRQPPRIAATAFHDDTRLYTLLMLDPGTYRIHTLLYPIFHSRTTRRPR